MKTDDNFYRFGEVAEFALDLRLMDDPDGDSGAPHDSVGSWGRWRLWVNGVNLCKHDFFPAEGDPRPEDAVAWYLAPLLQWIAATWAPLLHEERLPSPSRETTARDAYLSALAVRSRNGEAFVPWQNWSSRHSLRWAAEGGLVPDLFLRRLGDDIEVSWGDRIQPGGDAAQFRLETGAGYAPVEAVAQALDGALQWAIGQPALQQRPWFAGLVRAIDARHVTEREATWLSWFIDGCDPLQRLTGLYRKVKAEVERVSPHLFDQRANELCLTGLSPAVAMFGALSPQMSGAAARRLLEITADSMKTDPVSAVIDRFVESQSVRAAHSPWDQGYGLAGYFLEDADALSAGDCLDVDALLGTLDVVVRNESLGRDGPRGVALAGTAIVPTVVVNTEHAANRFPSGRRFTLAHELCHVLYDRDRARRVTHTSTPWAPQAVEQRANAFAAMLLMPPELIRRVMTEVEDDVDVDTIANAARTMQVSRTALIHHLANLDEISEMARDRLLDELDVSSNPGQGAQS